MNEAFTPHYPGVYVINEAETKGIVLPRIEIADQLQLRLSRRGRILHVNDAALLYGATQAEIENPVTVRVDALPKDIAAEEDEAPEADFERLAISAPVMDMRIDATPETSTGKTLTRLNTTFWLGILASDYLKENPGYGTQASREVRYSHTRGLLFGTLANVSVTISDEILGTVGVIANQDGFNITNPVEITAFAGGLAAFGIINNQFKKFREMTAGEYASRKVRKQAIRLAKEHPALEYDVLGFTS